MKNTLLLCAGIIIFIGSCKKPDTTPTTVSTFSTYSSLDTIYQMLEVKPKYVSVNGATGGTFYGTSGTRYIIPPNCLQDGAGNPVTTNVQFEVAEYLKKGDMIFSKMLPLSNGEPLLSGGQISIKATLSGMPIYLKSSGCTFTATIPKDKDTTTGMQFFIGQELKGNDTANVNWNHIDSAAGGGGGKPWGHIVYNGDTISIISDSLSLCNADRFLPYPYNYKTFKVTPSAPGGVSITSSTQLSGYAFYDNYKSAWSMYNFNKGIFNEDHVPGIPVHFAVYGLINNRFYAGVVAATPANGGNYTVTLTEADPAAFKAQLNNLTK